MSTIIGIYRPGRGLLHRLRPGAKLIGLLLLAIIVISTSGWISTAAALAVGIGLAALSGLRGRDFWQVSRGFAFIALPLFLFTAASSAITHGSWPDGLLRGFEVVGDLLALILAASAFTASTATSDLLDTIIWALHPLRPIGVDPDRVALAFSLAIRAIPGVQELARETQQAARARGLDRSLRARVVPFVLRTVAQAQATGDALAARGIGED